MSTDEGSAHPTFGVGHLVDLERHSTKVHTQDGPRLPVVEVDSPLPTCTGIGLHAELEAFSGETVAGCVQVRRRRWRDKAEGAVV